VSGSSSALDSASHWAVRHRKGHVIYGEGDPPQALYRLEKGCVRLQTSGADGGRQIMSFHFPGDVFGLCVTSRQSSAEAVTDVELTRYSLPSVLDQAAEMSALTVELLQAAEALYGDLVEHVEQLTRMPAPERVLAFFHWLVLRVHGRSTGNLQVPMSRRDIADYLGVSQETLSRIIRRLEDNGILVAKGSRTLVLKTPATESRSWQAPAIGSSNGASQPACGDNVAEIDRKLTPVKTAGRPHDALAKPNGDTCPAPDLGENLTLP